MPFAPPVPAHSLRAGSAPRLAGDLTGSRLHAWAQIDNDEEKLKEAYARAAEELKAWLSTAGPSTTESDETAVRSPRCPAAPSRPGSREAFSQPLEPFPEKLLPAVENDWSAAHEPSSPPAASQDLSVPAHLAKTLPPTPSAASATPAAPAEKASSSPSPTKSEPAPEAPKAAATAGPAVPVVEEDAPFSRALEPNEGAGSARRSRGCREARRLPPVSSHACFQRPLAPPSQIASTVSGKTTRWPPTSGASSGHASPSWVRGPFRAAAALILPRHAPAPALGPARPAHSR